MDEGAEATGSRRRSPQTPAPSFLPAVLFLPQSKAQQLYLMVSSFINCLIVFVAAVLAFYWGSGRALQRQLGNVLGSTVVIGWVTGGALLVLAGLLHLPPQL